MLHYNKTLENTKLNLSYREVILPLLIPLFLLFWISRRSNTVVVFCKQSTLNLMVQQSCNPPVLQNRLVHFRVITSPVPKGKIRHPVTARPAENRALVWWRFVLGSDVGYFSLSVPRCGWHSRARPAQPAGGSWHSRTAAPPCACFWWEQAPSPPWCATAPAFGFHRLEQEEKSGEISPEGSCLLAPEHYLE